LAKQGLGLPNFTSRQRPSSAETGHPKRNRAGVPENDPLFLISA
jgi:hypothetical protein